MAGCGEVLADDFGDDAGGGPDADAGHRGQDLGKRVILDQPLHLLDYLAALGADLGELRG